MLPVRPESVLLCQVEGDWRREGWRWRGEAGRRDRSVWQFVHQGPQRSDPRHAGVGGREERELVLVVHPGTAQAGRGEFVTRV